MYDVSVKPSFLNKYFNVQMFERYKMVSNNKIKVDFLTRNIGYAIIEYGY